jgi:hypothetical protein
MIHWFIILVYLLTCLIICLFFNIGLLNLLISGETIICLMFYSCLVLASFFNIYYMFGVAFFIFVISSIEIIFNFLVISSDKFYSIGKILERCLLVILFVNEQ